ncbi:MAG: hypothetical protein AB8H80_08645 [Planctomycetota bacterium]
MNRLAPALLPALLLFASGCASTSDLDELRDQPPVPMVVLVQWDADESPMHIRYGEETVEVPAEELTELLAQELRALDTGSMIGTKRDLRAIAPDLTLTMRQEEPIVCSHEGTSGFLASGGLWLVTWVGGLLVEDSAYRVAMNASCTFANSEDNRAERSITGDVVELSFFDRNDLVSWPGLQSLVLPPFWTSDQTETTIDALKRSAMRIAARKIANDLKVGFDERYQNQLRCAVEMVQPARNKSEVTGVSMPLDVRIRIDTDEDEEEPVTVEASINGGDYSALEVQPDELNNLALRARGTLNGLAMGTDNWVRLRIRAEETFTRTIRLVPAKK